MNSEAYKTYAKNAAERLKKTNFNNLENNAISLCKSSGLICKKN